MSIINNESQVINDENINEPNVINNEINDENINEPNVINNEINDENINEPNVINNIKYVDINILVHCGGKCGSSTLYNTFINNGYKSIKIHNRIDFINQCGYDGLFDSIKYSSLNKKVYIIDVYRTPIERKISSFFQNIIHHVPDYKNKMCEELIDIFNIKFIDTIEEYHSINEIFDEYNIEHFKDFDFQKKYNIKEVGNLVFVKLLFNDIKIWNILLSLILNKYIVMYNDNLTENKDVYELYKEFKKIYRVPKTYIKYILMNDKEFKIYNTKEEQYNYIIDWLFKSY